MAKKRIPIDYIPQHSQQRRSTISKRRTDFSSLMRTFDCLFNPVSSPGSSSGQVRSDSVSTSSLQEDRMEEQFFIRTLIKCNGSLRDENLDAPVTEVESITRDEAFDVCNNEGSQQVKNNTFMVSESTPQESPVSNSDFINLTPGSVVWAKTSPEMWWPAEIMEERPTLAAQACDGHVLVHFYGNQPCAWIDPVKDLAAFENSFEERSNNPAKDFQDALKQALQRKEKPSSCRKLSSQSTVRSDLQYQSCEKRTSSASSKAVDDLKESGRGKRERKRKRHFDEVASRPKSEKSKRKARQLRIMRHLGLIAPAGSPYCTRPCH